jgi:hypothetical protein
MILLPHLWLRRGATVLAAPLAVALAGCSPAQRIYSLDPVDRRGRPLVWERVQALTLEDGSAVNLEPGDSLRLRDGTVLRTTAASRARGADAPALPEESWEISAVKRVELAEPSGGTARVDVLTPEDLLLVERQPRVDHVLLRDGTALALDTAGPGPRRALGDTAVDLPLRGGGTRRVALTEIASLEVERPSVLAATVGSPAAWVVGGAAVAVLMLVVRNHDTHNTAVK